MKKLLLSCDQVFDVLTRGPFPTGDESDEQVEHHLRACHDCRQLAEALRPAVELFHEVVAEDQALDLPEYQGSLPDPGPPVQRLSVVRLATRQEREVPADRPLPLRGYRSRWQLVAASLLVFGLSIWLAGMAAEQREQPLAAALRTWVGKPAAANEQAPEGLPTDVGLISLASLKLPVVCLPLTHRPLSQAQASEIALALIDGTLDKLRCCTECHHAGQSATNQPEISQSAGVQSRSKAFAAAVTDNCRTCHRG